MNERHEIAVDITNCDREPIHIPGAIQPHGVLLAIEEPGYVITQTSENAQTLFGEEPSRLLGRPLSSVLPSNPAIEVQEAAKREHLSELNPFLMVVGGRVCDGVLHRHQGALILEIEPRAAAAPAERTHHPLRRLVSSLQSAATLNELLDRGAAVVRRLTGFERVMIYAFDEEGHGSVDAEARDEGLEPYLGLHYPASDIPRQARELYLRNPIRSIPDARYIPVPLMPPLRPDTRTPLDLSFAFLRSVSPIHLEYMANMGIRASMSISLVVHDRLWGLISCAQHSGPHGVPYEVRSDCEVAGRVMSLLIGAFEDREVAEARQRRQPLLDVLADKMHGAEDLLAALLACPGELFALLRIDGAAALGEHVLTAGAVPPVAAIEALSKWLQQAGGPGVFTTHSLATVVPDFSMIRDSASGIVSFALPGAVPRRFIGFRPELIQTVDWGGDPRKPMALDTTARLHPRRSFALWREEVRMRSLPWRPLDCEAAEDLRRLVIEIDLARQVERAQRAVRARDDVVAVVSHDLKNPLQVMQIEVQILRNIVEPEADERSADMRASLDNIGRSVNRMDSLIRDLLDLARIEAGGFAVECTPESLDEMICEALMILRPVAEEKGVMLSEQVEAGIYVLMDRARIFQVLSNLIGNAIKFTPRGGRIVLRASTENGHARVEVTDTGPGLTPEQASNVFNRYWQSAKAAREGVGLGLYIAKGIVEAHGGRIWFERADQGGATFVFTLELAVSPAQ